MIRLPRAAVIALSAAMMLSVSGCRKKKPAVPAPQAQAPTIETPAPAQPETAPAPAPATSETTTTTTTPAPAPAPKPRRHVAKKPSAGVPTQSNPASTVATNGTNPTPPPGANPPNKVVVPDGSAPEPTNQISTTMPPDKESETKLNTERSLQNTEKNLKGITWAPSGDQRVMIDQIKTYINQSRSANTAGDVVRASNLAQKARLLCDELLKK